MYMYVYIYMNDIRCCAQVFPRYKVSLTWGSNPRPSDFRSNALPTELASLT